MGRTRERSASRGQTDGAETTLVRLKQQVTWGSQLRKSLSSGRK